MSDLRLACLYNGHGERGQLYRVVLRIQTYSLAYGKHTTKQNHKVERIKASAEDEGWT